MTQPIQKFTFNIQVNVDAVDHTEAQARLRAYMLSVDWNALTVEPIVPSSFFVNIPEPKS